MTLAGVKDWCPICGFFRSLSHISSHKKQRREEESAAVEAAAFEAPDEREPHDSAEEDLWQDRR